jgi:hypothetical protein
MGIIEEVLDSPATFLENRKDYAVTFSQFCHHHHLVFANGTSADLFRVDRPFGVYPFVSELPSYRTRPALLLILSCWRWANADHLTYDDECPTCHVAMNSPHLMFECVLTNSVRADFRRRTGVDFSLDSLQDAHLVEQVAKACELILHSIPRIE